MEWNGYTHAQREGERDFVNDVPGVFGNAAQKVSYCESSVSASGNSASAPASTYARARSIVPCMPADDQNVGMGMEEQGEEGMRVE